MAQALPIKFQEHLQVCRAVLTVMSYKYVLFVVLYRVLLRHKAIRIATGCHPRPFIPWLSRATVQTGKISPFTICSLNFDFNSGLTFFGEELSEFGQCNMFIYLL